MVQTFTAAAESTPYGGAAIALPFDPAKAWGARPRYHVTGTAAGIRFRTALTERRGTWRMVFGPKSSAGQLAGRQAVEVEVWPEGPQADGLAPDITDALASRPAAIAAFSGLATFYRKGFMRWIDGAKRSETRARRIADTVAALRARNREP